MISAELVTILERRELLFASAKRDLLWDVQAPGASSFPAERPLPWTLLSLPRPCIALLWPCFWATLLSHQPLALSVGGYFDCSGFIDS